jgi:YgiT-type zinc finger domain-containing protein
MEKTSIDYQYKASGLNNIFLKNIPALTCHTCGQTYPIISRIEDIRAQIADRLVNKKSIITGKSFSPVVSHLLF